MRFQPGDVVRLTGRRLAHSNHLPEMRQLTVEAVEPVTPSGTVRVMFWCQVCSGYLKRLYHVDSLELVREAITQGVT